LRSIIFRGLAGLGLEEVLTKLKESGLQIMPEEAPRYSQRASETIVPEKISGERWREVMEVAHHVGIKTNATMLYGHLETFEDRVGPSLQVAGPAGQDRRVSGIYLAGIPPEEHRNRRLLFVGIDDLKTIAMSRLILDNFGPRKGLLDHAGRKISQTALLFGADDLEALSSKKRSPTWPAQ